MLSSIKEISKEDEQRLKRYLNVHCGKELHDVAKKAAELEVQHAEFQMKDGSIRSFFCPKLAQFYTNVKKANLAKSKTNDGNTSKNDAADEQDANVKDVPKK